MSQIPKIFVFDASAACLAGLFASLFHGFLSSLYALPGTVIVGLGLVNLAYASYGFYLLWNKKRTPGQVMLLIFANMAWAPVCFAIVLHFWQQIRVFGILHLVFEALFVLVLAKIEWKQRHLFLKQ